MPFSLRNNYICDNIRIFLPHQNSKNIIFLPFRRSFLILLRRAKTANSFCFADFGNDVVLKPKMSEP